MTDPVRQIGVLIVLGVLMVAISSASAQQRLQLELLVNGLDRPVYLTHADDGSGRLFVVEQPGRIRIVEDGALLPAPFLDIQGQVLSGGERGLLGLAFHPRYARNGRFFVNYTRQDDGVSVIAEYGVSADPDHAQTSERVLC